MTAEFFAITFNLSDDKNHHRRRSVEYQTLSERLLSQGSVVEVGTLANNTTKYIIGTRHKNVQNLNLLTCPKQDDYYDPDEVLLGFISKYFSI